MSQVVLITGASSGFGLLTAQTLALQGHIVYAGMRDLDHRNAQKAEAATKFAMDNQVALNPIDLDIQRQSSIDQAVETIIDEQGTVDVVVHNAGHMTIGPTEAFTAEQLAELYDVNVLGTQRVNRAVLPHMRKRGIGYLVWVSSTSVRGGIPPFLGPYFAAKAGMDALAVTYAYEVARWGIESTIVVPGVFTEGTSHFEHAGQPADSGVAAEYARGPYAGIPDIIMRGLDRLEPDNNNPQQVADAIATLLASPVRERPFRVHVDLSQDGCEVVDAVMDRVRAEFLRRTDLGDLLIASSPSNAN